MQTLFSTVVLFSNVFVERFKEGGSLFMSLILICLVLSLIFLTLGFIQLKKDNSKSIKMRILASETSILGLVIGFLGSLIGMITAFDAIGSMNDISASIMASGLKVSFLTTVFGSITFILPRIGILILRTLQKE